MAHFYGTIQGCRGEASRLGSKDSGLQLSAYSWDGGVRVELYIEGGINKARVSLAPHFQTGAGVSRLLYDGPVNSEKGRK